MDDGTPGQRTCEVCGRPIQRNNTTGICTGIGGTTECRRVRAERNRRARGVKVKVRHVCGHPDGCPEPATRNGYCVMHAARLNRRGELGPAGFINKPRVFMTGETFGRWTVMEDYDAADYRVRCRCECGTERRVLVAALKGGKSQSCGCLHRSIVRQPKSRDPYLLAGQVFERITLLEDAAGSGSLVRVLCECGTETVKRAVSIKMGNTRSCGCLGRETHQTHGLSGHPLWHTWTGVISRTTNPKDTSYKYYGAEGKGVCARWQGKPDGFLNFVADMGERPDGMTLDRKDPEGGYWCGRCPECVSLGRPANCRWATRETQASNKRSVAVIALERNAALAEVARLSQLLAPAPQQRRKPTPVAVAQDMLF